MVDIRKIDEICDAFEASWKTGDVPHIADFLDRVVDSQRKTLVRELVVLDVEYRHRSGQRVLPNDYAMFGADVVQVVKDSFPRHPDHSTDHEAIKATVLAQQPGIESPFLTTQAASAEPPSVDSIDGAVLGDYVILDEIARGGMGVVYKARHHKLDRIVALKMILAGRHAGDEEVERFQTEARAAARLDHSGIVPVYEIGEYNDQHFFTMGFVEGQSLSDKVRDTTLSPRLAAQITRQIAQAVAHAHDHGVIHRDLKPSNVLMDVNEQPKVTDFGLARTVEQDVGLTQTGAVMGTPSYMAPEQAAGLNHEIGPLSDVYALGGILYRLLTGRPPFQASTVLETLRQVSETQPVSPQSLNSEVDGDLETLCLKCLEKASGERPASAAFIAEELERYLDGVPILSRKPSRLERVQKWCVRNRAESAVIVMAIMIITLGGVLFATTALPHVSRLWGEHDATNVMIMLSLAGPAVTMTRLFGVSSARPVESLFMNLGKNCLCFSYAMVVGFVSFLTLCLVFAGFNYVINQTDDPVAIGFALLSQVLFASATLLKHDLKRSLTWMWASLGLAIAGIFLALLWAPFVLVFMVFALIFGLRLIGGVNLGITRLLYGPAHRYAISVKRAFGWVPWPISVVAGPFRIRSVVLLTNLFPLVILWGIVQLAGSILIVTIAIPIWAFEQLRLILFPQSQRLTESLGYVISAMCVVAMLTKWAM